MNQSMPINQSSKSSVELAPLKVGVICSSLNLSAWQARALHSLKLQHAGSIDLIIETRLPAHLDDKPAASLPYLFGKLKTGKSCPELRQTSIKDEFPKAHHQPCELQSTDKNSFQLSSKDLQTIGALDLDFILDFTAINLTGEILSIPHYGVWHFGKSNGANEEHYLPFFWAVFNKKPLTTAFLFKTAVGAGAKDEVLRSGSFKTTTSFASNLSQVLSTIWEWPTSMANQIRHDAYAVQKQAYPELSSNDKNNKLPTTGQLWIFVARQTLGLTAKIVNRLTLYTKWRVGIAKISFDELLQKGMPEHIDWAPDIGKNHFISDPFALDRSDHLDVLVEDYKYTRGTGSIATLRYESHTGWSKNLTQIINEKHHMSYPFLLHTNETHYLIPETHKAGHLYCYEIDPDRLEVLEKKTFIENLPVIDPTLFFHEGRWYLFGDISAANSRFTLRLWCSDAFFGPWTAHPLNPIICDIATARPAGAIISHNGRLYRPAQNSTRQYGEAISLMEIIKLTPTQYEEKLVMNLRPHPAWTDSDGVHTLGVTSQGIIIDGKKKHLSVLSVLFNIYPPIRRRLHLYSKSN